jgi:outer membrane lipase/esterase
MKFESRGGQWWSAWGLAAALAVLIALASCGGGDRVGTFEPERLVAFGDETSVITSDGRKYSVNAVDANGAIACALSPNWTQYLAQAFGLVFAQCNPTNIAVTALSYATPGAKVTDIKTQIDQHLATGSFGGRDLVTVLAGVNDIIEQYRLFPAQSEDTLVAVLEDRGAALAAQVNRIATAGGKVLIATAPDISVSPFSGAENAANPGSDRQAVLKRLVDRFNAGLRINLINDGTKIGLVFADEQVQSMVKTPSSYGLVNVANVACAIAPPACTTLTLVTGASGETWLWADSLLLSPFGQRQIGAVAESRARNNPF